MLPPPEGRPESILCESLALNLYIIIICLLIFLPYQIVNSLKIRFSWFCSLYFSILHGVLHAEDA